jgi:hypothetical protein
MPDPSVTFKAIPLKLSMLDNLAHHYGVALHTVLLQQVAVRFGDTDRLAETLQRKRDRVFDAILRFREPLSSKIVGHMARVATRYGLMARSRPTRVGVVHNVAIDARSGVVR